MRTPRYEVRSIAGYNALGSGVAGEGKLATTWWVADTWRCYYEVPLQVVDSGSGRGRKWKHYRTRGKTTTRRVVAERNCERLILYLEAGFALLLAVCCCRLWPR